MEIIMKKGIKQAIGRLYAQSASVLSTNEGVG